MKFLIIRFSSIGDIVLTSPVVRCLKQQVPGAEVHFLTKQAFGAILENNPYIDKVHVLADSFELMVHELKLEEYDYIIDLHHNLRTLRVKKALGKKSYSFRKLNLEKWMLTSFKIDFLPDLHIVDRNFVTVAPFGVRNDDRGLDYFIPPGSVVKESDIPAAHLAGYIGLVIGAAYSTKKLPLHKLKDLCALIDHPIIILGGKEDREEAAAIAEMDPVRLYNACGKFSLHESADLVRRSKLVITHDTGLMHIAAAFQKPIISIWGNTIPKFGMYPYYGGRSSQQFDVFEINSLRCRPCSKIGYNKCPKGHFKCMEMIDINAVAGRVKERLSRTAV